VLNQIKQHIGDAVAEPRFYIEHEDLMIPFKCYLNCDLKGCHSVKRLKILKNIQERYDQVIFYPIMAEEELFRVYISLGIDRDMHKLNRRKSSHKDDNEEKLIFDLIVSKRKSDGDEIVCQHKLYMPKKGEKGSKGDVNIKMRKIPHDSFFISQGMVQISNKEPLKEDEYYLIQV
jgi:hypothetical protein